MFVVVNFVALAQTNDFRIERRQFVLICWFCWTQQPVPMMSEHSAHLTSLPPELSRVKLKKAWTQHIYIYIHIHVHVQVRVHVHVQVHKHTHTHTHIHICYTYTLYIYPMHIHIPYTNTYAYTHTHTYMHMRKELMVLANGLSCLNTTRCPPALLRCILACNCW